SGLARGREARTPERRQQAAADRNDLRLSVRVAAASRQRGADDRRGAESADAGARADSHSVESRDPQGTAAAGCAGWAVKSSAAAQSAADAAPGSARADPLRAEAVAEGRGCRLHCPSPDDCGG